MTSSVTQASILSHHNLSLSCTAAIIAYIDWMSIFPAYVCKVLRNVPLGSPFLFLLPSTSQVEPVSSFRFLPFCTYALHIIYLLILNIFDADIRPDICLISLVVLNSNPSKDIILLRHLFSKESIFLSISVVIFQLSAPYNCTDRTFMELKSLNF